MGYSISEGFPASSAQSAKQRVRKIFQRRVTISFCNVWKRDMEKTGMKINSKTKRYYIYTAAFLAIVLLMILTVIGWRYYVRKLEGNGIEQLTGGTLYERHYAMIPDDADSGLWQEIYDSARETAEQNQAYVELFADWAAGDYTPLEYMEIAIAAQVDGIIIKPDGTRKMRDMINQAETAGIPVITVLDDDIASSRKSFVGINSYQLGTTYGRQILECVDENTEKITVFLNANESGKERIFKELNETVLHELPQEQREKMSIEPLTISNISTFYTEDVIRELISNEESRPDILVCTSEIDSVCAYHAMIDYNLVGDFHMIGYYQSDTMLDAIEKGTVPMAITMNAQQIGASSVEALEEYYEMGHVSDYHTVDLSIITRTNVQLFREENKSE